MKRKASRKNFIWCMVLAGTLIVSQGLAALPAYAAEVGSDGGAWAPADESGAAAAAPQEAGAQAVGEPDASAPAADTQTPQAVPEQEVIQSEAAPKPAGDGGISVTKETQGSGTGSNGSSNTPDKQETKGGSNENTAGGQPPTKQLDANTQKTDLKIVVQDEPQAETKKMAEATEMVDAPPIVPEGSAIDNNIFGVEGQYYVTIPKSMSFRKLANGDYETLQSSYYTVNSGMERGYKLSVRVSGINTDDTVQLANDTTTVYRKAEVSTMACDIWQYRPDGTVLNVVESDPAGYGKELVLDGPGKFKAKCRLKRYADDVLTAGTWSGSILFTVTCSPEPKAKSGQQESESGTGRAASGSQPVQQPSGAQAVAENQATQQPSGDQTAAVNQATQSSGGQSVQPAPADPAAASSSQQAAGGAAAPTGNSAQSDGQTPPAFQSADVNQAVDAAKSAQQPAAGTQAGEEKKDESAINNNAEPSADSSEESVKKETDAMAPRTESASTGETAANEEDSASGGSEAGSAQEDASPEAAEGAE